MNLRALPTLLVAAAALALAVPAGAASADERIAAVTIDGGPAVFSGGPDGLPARRPLRGADRAVLSPDGRLVAYARLVRRRAEIRIARVAGGGDRLLARVAPFDVSLAFSPDGARLAYTSADGLATVAVRGGAPRRVRLPDAWRGSRYAHVAYAPDARRLLLSRTTGDGRAGTLRNELVAVDLATGRGTTLFPSPSAYDQQARPASFTPDSAYVAVDGLRGIQLVPTTPGEPRALTAPPRNSTDRSPVVSPDGRWVAFARSPYGGVADVWVVAIDGTDLRRLTTTPIPPRGVGRVGSSPLAWSPDGTKLLTFRHDRFAIVDVETRASSDLRKVGLRYGIASARWTGTPPEPPRTGTIVFERRDESGRADLYTVRADGSGLRRLTDDGLSFDPAWSPDGDRIAFTGGDLSERQLFTMKADGSARLQLTRFGPGRAVYHPSWFRGGPTGLRILFGLSTGHDVSDLYGIGSDGRTAMPVADSPEPEEHGVFSPTGALAYESRGVIWIREEGVTRRLGPGTRPQWSPDGRRLTYLLHSGLHGGAVSVVGADGTGYRGLGWGVSPSWSPDGTAIVYGADDGLYVVRADGLGRSRRLTRTPRLVSDLSPSWRAH